MTFTRVLYRLCVFLILCGCIPPATTATIVIGQGKHLGDMEQVERMAEEAGFSRIWSEPKDKDRQPRFRDGDRVVSNFQLIGAGQSFGIVVTLSADEGLLSMVFAERNDHFSEKGKSLLSSLSEQVKQIK